MMGLRLRNLIFVGQNVEDSVPIEFSPQCTVLHCSPEVSRSLVDAIDFVLGARKSKAIEGWEKYSHILLGVELPPIGEPITVVRSVDTGSSEIYWGYIDADILDIVHSISGRYGSDTSLHMTSVEKPFRNLLCWLGLEGKLIRINSLNEKRKLRFRDLARFSLVDTSDMQATKAPGFSGNNRSKVMEESVLKFVLSGKDDSNLGDILSPEQLDPVLRIQHKIINEMVAELETQLLDVATIDDLRHQLSELNSRIDKHNSYLSPLIDERSVLYDEHRKLQDHREALAVKQAETITLRCRFDLLEEQYQNDLSRLDMIAESRSLLTYLQPGSCTSCGATLTSQHHSPDCAEPESSVYHAANVESRKTEQLLAGLYATTVDMDNRIDALQELIDEVNQDAEDVQQRIQLLDAKINQKEQETLRVLFNQHSEVEKRLNLHEQAVTCSEMLKQLTTRTEGYKQPEGIDPRDAKDLSNKITERLNKWGYPAEFPVYYDPKKCDIIARKKPRSVCDKEERAVLHAAFTLSIAQHCYENMTPHLGFVVLNSPHIPDQTDKGRFAEAFYHDLDENRTGGQVIIIEDADTDQLPKFLIHRESGTGSLTQYVDLRRNRFIHVQAVESIQHVQADVPDALIKLKDNR